MHTSINIHIIFIACSENTAERKEKKFCCSITSVLKDKKVSFQKVIQNQQK